MTPDEIRDEIVTFGDQAGVDVYIRALPCGEIELTDLFARETGKGAGTKVMNRLCELADAAGLNIYTTPSEPRNVTFYGRFGFETSRRYWGLPLERLQPPPKEAFE
jgi:GNAT superfamily N-acetyltransferase